MAMALSEVVPEHMAISLSSAKPAGAPSNGRSMCGSPTPGEPGNRLLPGRYGDDWGRGRQGLGMFSLSGEGCGWVTDWGRAMDVCTDQLPAFELKRVDLA